MKFRGTLVAILLFSGLLAFIYFYEYKGEEGREEAKRAEETPLSFDREKVTMVEIERPGAEKVALAREGSVWKLTSPIVTRADAEKVDALLSGLGWLKIERRLEDVSAEELASFGLQEPAARVAIHVPEAGAGRRDLAMKVSAASGIGGNRYVSLEGSPDVLLVSGSLDPLLSADTTALRFKKIVGVNSWDLTRFSLATPGGGLTLSKEGEAWTLEGATGTGNFPAEGTRVTSLWSDVQSADAEGFAVERPTSADLERFGLVHPALTLTVEAKPLQGSLRIEFGRSDSEGVHARRSDMESLLIVKPEILDKLLKAALAPDDLRDARVAPVDRYRLKELTIDRAGAVVSLFKDDESKWHWGAADGPAIDSEEVNPLLDAIEELKAVRYLPGDAAGTAPGEATLTLREGEGEGARTVTVKVTSRHEGADEARLLVSSAAGAVYVVPQKGVQTLMERAAGLKEPAKEAAAAPESAPAEGAPAEKATP